MEKKKLMVNTTICDMRNISESVLESYKSIEINAASVILTKETKDLISKYNVNINAADVMEAPKEAEIVVHNGAYEISDSILLSKPVILMVNGTLEIKAISKEVLEKFVLIIVNGIVSYPLDIKGILPRITVNGSIESYPSDAIKLKSKLIMDKTFIMRAKDTKYYVRNKVVIPDENLDISSLVDTGATFITKEAIIAEDLLDKALFLFDEDVDIKIIPAGYKYTKVNVLNDSLIRKYGDNLYIDGDLTIELESENALNKLSKLKVNGNVFIVDKLKDKFYDINPEYRALKTIKGIIIEDKASITIDEYLLNRHEEGVTVLDCGTVFIKDSITADEIEEKLQFIDCGYISCSREQKNLVELVSEDVGYIDDSGNSKKNGLGKLLEGSKMFDEDTKVINAAKYTM